MYYLLVCLRNFLFDKKIFKAKSFKNLFVLCVGNIRVGGTGKTPMIEYLINNLQNTFPLAVVSLGYGRKTNGLIELSSQSTNWEVGDEPKQLKDKYPNIHIFVSKNRNTAIEYIQQKYPHIKVILLDDAMQYRKTLPTKTILLTEYNRPFFKDRILPYGFLRESKKAAHRSQYIICTKTPQNITQNDKDNFISQLNKKPYQKVYFSYIDYLAPYNYKDNSTICLTNKPILLVVGIDNPEPMIQYLKTFANKIKVLKFLDHHNFTQKDIIKINTILNSDKQTLLVTTQKDATRLSHFKNDFVILPIQDQVDTNFLNDLNNDIRQYFTSHKLYSD